MQPIDCGPIYRYGKHYDLQNDDLVADIPFYIAQAKMAVGPVLEVACGTGRITIPVAKAGVNITGLDLSASMLVTAKEKAKVANLSINWIEADCRTFSLEKQFDLIYIPFNSMQHLHDRESLDAFFSCVKSHLSPNGTFIVDVFNPSIKILNRDPLKRMPVAKYPDPDGNGEVIIEETNVYDDVAQVNRIKWYYSIGDRKDVHVEDLNMRCFFPQELDAILYYNAFRIMDKFGDFERKPFRAGNTKQIVVCKARK